MNFALNEGWTKSRAIVGVAWTSYENLSNFGSLLVLKYFVFLSFFSFSCDIRKFLTSWTYWSLKIEKLHQGRNLMLRPYHLWSFLLEWNGVHISWPSSQTMLHFHWFGVYLWHLLGIELAQECHIVRWSWSQATLIRSWHVQCWLELDTLPANVKGKALNFRSIAGDVVKYTTIFHV